MKKKIQDIIAGIEKEEIKNNEEFSKFKKKYSTLIKELNDEFITLPVETKREVGASMNLLKNKIKSVCQNFEIAIKNQTTKKNDDKDYTLPVDISLGCKHPLTQLGDEMSNFFLSYGFDFVDAPEIEDDWHNFTALNMPYDHPARDMQETFFLDNKKQYLLRTHTTSAQIRTLENKKPPLYCFCMGKVFRNETVSARSSEVFHQIDCFVVDKNISFVDFKTIVNDFLRHIFGSETKMRIRPSYFPFTSPSVEIDIECLICRGRGCSICKKSGWLEILGGGLIHDKVLENCNIDSSIYSGYAFGGGLERTAILIHGINDIRLFYENDMRFLRQFR